MLVLSTSYNNYKIPFGLSGYSERIHLFYIGILLFIARVFVQAIVQLRLSLDRTVLLVKLVSICDSGFSRKWKRGSHLVAKWTRKRRRKAHDGDKNSRQIKNSAISGDYRRGALPRYLYNCLYLPCFPMYTRFHAAKVQSKWDRTASN